MPDINKKEIQSFLNEIKAETEKIGGWEQLKVEKIHKYGVEAKVYTSAGILEISMRELFLQYSFQQRVFEEFGIVLDKVKDNVYREWLSMWTKTLKDMGKEYGTTLDNLKYSLDSYLEMAEERDIAYLKKGEPIILPDGTGAFNPTEFVTWLKKKTGQIYTDDKMRSILTDLGCTNRTLEGSVGKVRAWVYPLDRLVEVREEPKKVEVRFVSKAPEVMAEESTDNINNLEENSYEF